MNHELCTDGHYFVHCQALGVWACTRCPHVDPDRRGVSATRRKVTAS